MSELLNINNNLTSSLNELIREISSRGFFGVRIWLDDNEINAQDLILKIIKLSLN